MYNTVLLTKDLGKRHLHFMSKNKKRKASVAKKIDDTNGKGAPEENISLEANETKNDSISEKKSPSKKWSFNKWNHFRKGLPATILLTIIIPAITTITLEWIARAPYAGTDNYYNMFTAFNRQPLSFLTSYIFLICIYVFISQLTRLHGLATAIVTLGGNLFGTVTYFKLTMRGEPFLPWDLSQIQDLMDINGSVSYEIPPCIIITAILCILLIVFACFIKIPNWKHSKKVLIGRLISIGCSLAIFFLIIFGVFLSKPGSLALGIQENPFGQSKYYLRHGVITAFGTNARMLKVSVPDDYSKAKVLEITEETEKTIPSDFLIKESYAANTENVVKQPNIIYLQAEAFWDPSELPYVEFDRVITPNLTRLSKEGASGRVFSPSYGGGTCDVEFEALTGFSMENLPSGSKPYQQYITKNTFSIAQYLRTQGYDTVGIHAYGAKFWNRNTAYPRLGFNDFISSDDTWNPRGIRRGFISDDSFVKRIIQEYEERTVDGQPVFIHSVSMQNHSTYEAGRYPKGEEVTVLDAPKELSEKAIESLQDYATGISEMDAALGTLTDYLSSIDEPTILVFWGDHLNNITSNYSIYESNGLIEPGEITNPYLFQTPLLIWSNYSDAEIDLGVVSSYYLSPLTMDMYGIEKPLFFEYLTEQYPIYHGRSRGYVSNPDGTISDEMTENQQEWFNKHAVLQYDYLFGQNLLDDYTPEVVSSSK